MSEEEKIAEQEAAAAAAQEAADAEAARIAAEGKSKTEAELLAEELERVKGEGKGKTELEKALFKKKQIDDRIAFLKSQTNGDGQDDEDEDKPVTVGMLKKLQFSEASKSSIEIAKTIEDANERDLTIHHLENTIKPSGDPQKDLNAARAIVNSVKNKMILDDNARKAAAKKAAAGGSAAAKKDDNFVPTAEELEFMKPPFSLSKEQIIAGRPKA